MTDTIMSLIEKLEGAETGLQELSARVVHAVRVPDGSVEQSKINGRWCVYDKNGRLLESGSRNGWWREGGWEVTESLDAALALAERVLPGWEFGTYINRPDVNGRRFTKIEAHRWQDVSPEYAFACASSKAATPALAVCAAVLRAQSEARV